MIEKIEKFIEEKGTVCPECGEEGIYATEAVEGSAKKIVHSVRCLKCNSTWKNIFIIKDVHICGKKTEPLQSIEYLCNDDHYCVDCPKTKVEADLGLLNINGRKAILPVKCHACNREWFAIYHLNEIKDYRINGQANYKVEVNFAVAGDATDEEIDKYIKDTISEQINLDNPDIKIVGKPLIKIKRVLK